MLVIGDYAVGKTSLIKRYCEGYFTPNYKLTIGVDFAVKDVEVDDNKVTLQVHYIQVVGLMKFLLFELSIWLPESLELVGSGGSVMAEMIPLSPGLPEHNFSLFRF